MTDRCEGREAGAANALLVAEVERLSEVIRDQTCTRETNDDQP